MFSRFGWVDVGYGIVADEQNLEVSRNSRLVTGIGLPHLFPLSRSM